MPISPIPSVAELRDVVRMQRYLTEVQRDITALQQQLASLQSAVHTQSQSPSTIDYAAIRDQLESTGDFPLSVEQLQGRLGSVQPAGLVILASTSSPDPSQYAIGTLGLISSGTTIYEITVNASGVHQWTALPLAPTNYVTTDSAQAIGPAAQKTFKDQTIFDSPTGAVLIKPSAAPVANTKLFDVQTSGGASIASIDSEGDATVNTLASGGAVTASTGTSQFAQLLVGSGNVITFVNLYSAVLTPAAVAANTTAEQTFAGFTGLATTHTVIVNKPSAQAGLGIVGMRCSAANTLAITFANVTAAPITPTAAETYLVVAIG